MKYGADLNNSNTINDTNKFNATGAMTGTQNNNRDILSTIEGQRGLYGTTPALTNTFGNQVMQGQNSEQNQQEINNRKLAGVYSSLGRFGQS